jgi:hypothetical protein
MSRITFRPRVLAACLKFFPEGKYLTRKCVSRGRKFPQSSPVDMGEPAEIRQLQGLNVGPHRTEWESLNNQALSRLAIPESLH